MADLTVDNTIEVDGLVMGDTGDPYLLAEIDGWEDDAVYDLGSSRRASDGMAAEATRARDRQVTIRFGIRAGSNVATAVDALRQVTAPPVDRSSAKVLRIRTRGVVRRALYRPASTPLILPGDEIALAHDHVDGEMRLWCPDPVRYSDTAATANFTVSGGGTDQQSVDNEGTFAAVAAGSPSLGAWSLTLTVASGGCTGPWLRHDGHTGEVWMLAESLGSGAVITVGPDRVTRRNGTLRSGYVVGPAGCPVAIWPVLRPGTQNLTMGAVTGGFTATLTYRSTW